MVQQTAKKNNPKKSSSYNKMNPSRASSEEAIHAPLLGASDTFCLRPLAIEPLAKNVASVATILVQMPQSQTMSFGCVLMPANQSNFQAAEA